MAEYASTPATTAAENGETGATQRVPRRARPVRRPPTGTARASASSMTWFTGSG